MSINPALLSHGVFIELSPIKALQRYANFKKPGLSVNAASSETSKLVSNFISALQFMQIGGVWIQLFR